MICEPSGVSKRHRLAVGVFQEQLPVVGDVELVRVDADLDRDGARRGFGTDDRPAATQDEEFAVGHLGGVGEEHGYIHAAQPRPTRLLQN